MTAVEAARHLKISRKTFDRLVSDGKLPQPRKLTERVLRWHVDWLNNDTAVDTNTVP